MRERRRETWSEGIFRVVSGKGREGFFLLGGDCLTPFVLRQLQSDLTKNNSFGGVIADVEVIFQKHGLPH